MKNLIFLSSVEPYNMKNLDDCYLIFRSLEKKTKIFDIEVMGVHIWDETRWDVFTEILWKLGIWERARDEVDKSPLGLMSIFFQTVKNSFGKNALFKSKNIDLLVFTYPRRKLQKDGKYWDLILDPLLDSNEFKTQAVEWFYVDKHRIPEKTESLKYLDFLIILSRIRAFFKKMQIGDAQDSVVRHFDNLVRENFEISVDIHSILMRALRRRESGRWAYCKLLDAYKPRAVLEVNRHWPLNEICSERGIPTIEMQHGAIDKHALSYDYPDLNRRVDGFPEYMFVFGDYWRDTINFPIAKSKVISVGHAYYENEISKYRKNKKIENRVVFISQGTIGKELSRMAVDFDRKYGKDFEILYKLHPNEYARWKREYPWLEEGNIKVIDDDSISIHEMLSKAGMQVGVYSTAIYEGLAFGLRTFIAELPGWESMADLIDGGYAVKVASAGELAKALKSADRKSIDMDYFFRRNALENQKRAIERLLEERR
jgi:hypothetical protein